MVRRRTASRSPSIPVGHRDVSSEPSESTKVEGERHGRAYDDIGPHASQVRESLRQELQKDIDKKVEEKTAALQGKVTDRLEGQARRAAASWTRSSTR